MSVGRVEMLIEWLPGVGTGPAGGELSPNPHIPYLGGPILGHALRFVVAEDGRAVTRQIS